MTTPNITPDTTAEIALDTAGVAGALWLLGAAFFGLLAMYFIGTDQGMVSVFGSDLHVHEFIHDARHALGFPCH
jgi:hypothetical protein